MRQRIGRFFQGIEGAGTGPTPVRLQAAVAKGAAFTAGWYGQDHSCARSPNNP